ncbi:MAG: hypothetical protein IKZ13_08040 [Akkermansia sp.]|nr:hypothetical protein [Akkermansia sp.]
MKVTTLILSVACAVALSSCCCQSQSAPILHPMPKPCGAQQQDATTQQPVEAPVKVLDVKGK